MSQINQNGSHLKKWVTLVETGHVYKKSSWTVKNGLDLKKWVTLEKMGYVFKKWFTLEKLVRFNNIDHIWRNVSSSLKKLVKL